MDQGPESKRPRLSTGSSWSAAPSHHGVSLPNPAPPPAPHHPTPPGQYQPPHPFSRPPDPHHHHPPPPLPPAPQHYDDRRHHEPEHFPPIQEHRQLPPSPAHHPYSAYPARDPMVKRDPEDALPQLRRPHSTGNAPEMPGTPHIGPVPPQPHPDDRRHLSFDNGPPPPQQHPPGPAPMYRQPSYPPPTPGPQSQPYDYALYSGPDQMYPIQYSTTAKRKTQRASQACDSCRSLKAKCDETKPCKNCREKNIECKYRDPVPKAQDKIQSEILDGIQLLRNEGIDARNEINDRFDHFERQYGRRLIRLERVLRYLHPDADMDNEPYPEEHLSAIKDPRSPVDEKPGEQQLAASPEEITQAAGSTAASVPSVTLEEAQRVLRQMNNDDEMDIEPGPPVAPGEPAMPVHHTTLAGLLLTWPPIAKKVSALMEKEGIKYPGEYPIRQEEQRGLLRVFGRGEGLDRSKVDKTAMADFGHIGASHADISDDMSDISSPSPGDVWGQTGGLSPPNSVDLKGGPLRPNGDLNFEVNEVWKYVKSFEDNIQNMHPLIPPKELHAMLKLFLDMLPVSTSTKNTKSATSIARFVHQGPTGPETASEIGSKRKRSPAADGPEPVTTPQKPGKPFRSMDTALILCVLALGKICLHKHGKLPDIVPESDAPPHQSPLLRNGHPASPSQGSPPGYQTHSQSSGLPSPRGDDRSAKSRRPSFQGHPPTPIRGSHSMKRNLDVIPGLEYFAVATDIIGNHIGGKTLKHVWVSILAGLYFGQLGRPLQSLEHIAMAGRTLQSLLRPHLDRFYRLASGEDMKKVETKRDNQLVFAFWSCLQLESDILAELQLPPSGILAYEDKMPYPSESVANEHGFSIAIVQSYLAQLYLRKRLNEIHKAFYDASRPDAPKQPSAKDDTFESLRNGLDPGRWVPPLFRFTVDDPPASDILSARLRAKFWGARGILYRPFLRQILLFNHKRLESNGNPAHFIETIPGDFRSEVNVPHIQSEAPVSEAISKQMTDYAMEAVKALIESTRSFHGLKEKRFIITNVFGTAHAQWGNLLILAAASDDPTLGQYIDKDVLRELFARTIEFFELVSHPSSSMTQDMNILKGLEQQLYEQEGREAPAHLDRGASWSLSSDRTGPPTMTPSPYPHRLPPPPDMPPVNDVHRAQHSPTQGQPPHQYPQHPPLSAHQHWLPPPPPPGQHMPYASGDARRPPGPDGR